MTAFGYVRKSVINDERTMSPAVQEDRIRALAKAHGFDAITVLSDLDISGAKVEERADYMRLVAAVESGEAEAIFAYDLSRLHRNTKEALRFFELCERHRVPVTMVEGNIDTKGPTGTLILTVLAAMNAWTSQVTSAKIKATFQMKKKHGDGWGGRRYGTRDGEDAQTVVDAFRDTGSLTRAARRLNEMGLPTRNAKSHGWSASGVRSVIERNAPELLIEQESSCTKAMGSRAGERQHRFARLLRCSTCGSLLTPSVDAKRGGYVRYYCSSASVLPHVRKSVPEATLMAAIRHEVEHVQFAMTRARKGDIDETTELASIDAERERVNIMFQKGRITEERYDATMDELDARSARLTAFKWVLRFTLPPDIEKDEPATVNAYLRRVFDHVTVDMGTPGHRGKTGGVITVTADLRDPSLRADYSEDDDLGPYTSDAD